MLPLLSSLREIFISKMSPGECWSISSEKKVSFMENKFIQLTSNEVEFSTELKCLIDKYFFEQALNSVISLFFRMRHLDKCHT